MFKKKFNSISIYWKKGTITETVHTTVTNIWWLEQRNRNVDFLSLDPSIPGQNDQQSNHYKIWGRDRSFEGIMHPHGQNSWEFQMKTTVFVMQHYIFEQTAASLELGCLLEWGRLVELERLLNKNTLEREHLVKRVWFLEGWH